VEEGEGGCCAGDPNERQRGGGGAWEGGGARGRGEPDQAGPSRTRPGRDGLGRAASQIETHNTHDTGSNRELKTETERDEHAISDKEMCVGMMQHPWHLGFGSYMTRTLVAILV
jgi:hypothetical protein